MSAGIVVALITSCAGLAVAVLSVPLNYAVSQRARREQTQDLMARYRDPLLWSVHDLRSRIRTILDDEFLTRFLLNGEDQILQDGEVMRAYARRHTMFVLAEYLGWVEIIRRSVGFLDLGDQRSSRALLEHLSIIRRVLFALDLSPVFHVPTGQQRGIGELMIVPDQDGGGRSWRCIGFAEFCNRLDASPDFAAWFERLDLGITNYASHPAKNHDRLEELSDRLTQLIDFLDPARTRFPLRHEERPHYLPPERAQ
jgi:hypothetical protein